MLCQGQVIHVLLVSVNSGISTMQMNNGKRKLWILFKNNSNVIRIFFIMIWFTLLTGSINGVVLVLLVLELNYLSILNILFNLCLTVLSIWHIIQLHTISKETWMVQNLVFLELSLKTWHLISGTMFSLENPIQVTKLLTIRWSS